jgi:hypothetical protein
MWSSFSFPNILCIGKWPGTSDLAPSKPLSELMGTMGARTNGLLSNVKG